MKYRLFNNDCSIELDNLINNKLKFNFILIDPPYELEHHGGTRKAMARRMAKVRDEIDFISNGFDYDNIFSKLIKLQNVVNMCIFCSNKQISKIMSWFENKNYSVTLLVWKKTNPSPLCNLKHVSDLEFIVYVRGKGAYWNSDESLDIKYKLKQYPIVNGKNKLHPTEKPIKLLEELIRLHTKENDVVLDCFMGSGSTGITCKNLNRNFVGIELNKKYFEIAKKRMEE